jgi:hypothetical protein
VTLILTCATRRSIVQVSDRRLTVDGRLYDDNTTKAVFYCGRVAIAYTGDARIAGQDTAEWLSTKLTGHANLEEALRDAARSFEEHTARQRGRRPSLAVVACGWATYKGAGTPRPFVCTVSNFLTEDGEWSADNKLEVSQRLDWLDSGRSHLLVCAGQGLNSRELARLDVAIRDSLRQRSEPFGLASALGEMIRQVSDDGTERGRRVGKGLIVQALSREAVLAGRGMILSPLTPDANSAIYLAQDGSTDRWLSPWVACGGGVFIGGGGPAGGPGSMTEQIEAQARSVPIVLPVGQSSVRVSCPFCAREGKDTLIEAELDEGEVERRTFCGGDKGHPLHVVRQ